MPGRCEIILNWNEDNQHSVKLPYGEPFTFRFYQYHLDFVQSGSVSEGVDHPAVYSAREFYQFRPQRGGRKSFLLCPDVPSDQGNGVGESGVGFWHTMPLSVAICRPVVQSRHPPPGSPR